MGLCTIVAALIALAVWRIRLTLSSSYAKPAGPDPWPDGSRCGSADAMNSFTANDP